MERNDRFEEFLRRLAAASPAKSHDEAFEMLTNILNSVEDEFSGVPADPAKYLEDGRLYPPQKDSKRTPAGRSDLVRYRSRGHNTWIGVNGAILIEDAPEDGSSPTCCLDKPGSDGKRVVK